MRQRFNDILKERHEHFDVYKLEGWKYFDEFIEFLGANLPFEEKKPLLYSPIVEPPPEIKIQAKKIEAQVAHKIIAKKKTIKVHKSR